MRLHNFFIEHPIGNATSISVEDTDLIHQWLKVFRMKTGDRVVLLDNSGSEYECEITMLSHDSARCTVVEKRQNKNILSKDVWLFQSLVKKDTFEWVAEKATELGVTHIVPIVSERSEKKDINVDRLKKIIREASEQSFRGTLPILHPVQNLEVTLSDVTAASEIKRIALHTAGPAFLHESMKSNKLAFFIGPEGGWTESEINLFSTHEVPVYSLGAQVLRSETAAIAALSLALLSS